MRDRPCAGTRTERLDGDLNPQVHVPKAENLLSTAGRRPPSLCGFKPPTTLSRERPGAVSRPTLSSIGGQPVPTACRGGAPGGGSCGRPKAHAANVAASLGEARALRLCLSYLSRGPPSPSLPPVGRGERGENDALLGKGWTQSKA